MRARVPACTTNWLRGVALGALPLLAVVSIASSAKAGSQIEVTADQRVTLSGEHRSLEALLVDLSWRAGFELRSFGIEDRTVETSMTEVPLDDALRRLVGRDLYTVGLSVGAGGNARITWVEVPGPNEAMGARRGRPKSRASDDAPFQVPAKLFLTAFESPDVEERAAALSMIRDHVLSDPAERARFLLTEEKRFVEALTKYPEAAGILRRLAGEQGDEAVRAKVEAVVAAIEAARAGVGPPVGAPPASH